MANDRTIATGIFSPPILKFSKLRCVCAPHSLSLGTRTSPMVSDSTRQPPPPPPSPRPEPSDTPCATNRPDDAEDDALREWDA